MHVLLRCLLLAMALALGVATAARADNPRISLKLDNVSGAEAVSALSKAAGVSIDIPERPFDPDGKVEAQLRERASFNWNNIRFAAALRELCSRYNVRPNRNHVGGGYTLHPALPPAPPGRRVGLTEKAGVRLFIRRITISNPREIDFEGGQGGANSGSMAVHLGGEVADGDPETFAGFTNVAAKDDLGNLLTSEQFGLGPWGFGGPPGSTTYPDEFSTSLNLPSPHPKARKLEWLEGELLVHKTYRLVTVEIPVPLPPQGGRKEAHGITFEVPRLETQPSPGNLPGGPTNEVVVQARTTSPRGLPISPRSRFGGSGALALRGASGKLFTSASGGSGGGGGERVTYNYNLTFHRVSEPVTAVVFTLVEKSDPEPLLSFRMTNIPLPGDPAFVPRRAARPVRPARPGAPASERPFFVAGGGILSNRIQIAGKPAPEGTLSLGLAPKEGTGWGAVRWTEVPVNSAGVASLPDLKPGTYRLLRVFQVKEAPQVRTDGAWQNAEVTVEVVAGKETAAPPLIWGPLPAPSLPGAKPTPKPPARRR